MYHIEARGNCQPSWQAGTWCRSAAIDEYRGYLPALQARVAALKQQGTSAAEAAKLLVDEFKQQYPAWDQPGRVQGAVAAVYKELP